MHKQIYLEGQIKTLQETLDNWVDEIENIHPIIMKSSKDAVISKLQEFKDELENLKKGITTKLDITDLRTEMAGLRTEIIKSKNQMLMYMFGFWLTQMLAFAGVVYTILMK